MASSKNGVENIGSDTCVEVAEYVGNVAVHG
jgi:hypothetical protein